MNRLNFCCLHRRDASSFVAGKSARIGELPKGKVGPLAQLVEQRTFNPWVDGSSPSGPTSNQKQFSKRTRKENCGQMCE